jgi:hypothetical protein
MSNTFKKSTLTYPQKLLRFTSLEREDRDVSYRNFFQTIRTAVRSAQDAEYAVMIEDRGARSNVRKRMRTVESMTFYTRKQSMTHQIDSNTR